MAAEVLSLHGVLVDVYDAMPSVGRKFLMAGKGGMNITHAEPYTTFFTRYGARQKQLQPMLQAFPPEALREWIHGLGIATFVGSSGRVFPTDMKAAPLLRAWLHRLRESGVRFHMRHRWLGWDAAGALRFATPEGERCIRSAATMLALGGGSWPQLGSDGGWVSLLQAKGVELAPLHPANCGFEVSWSDYFKDKFAGSPLKAVVASFIDAAGIEHRRQGDCVLTQYGIEGGLIYALSAPLRETIALQGSVTLYLDLLPGKESVKVLNEVLHPRGSRSLSSHLQSRLGVGSVHTALLHETLSREQLLDAATLAQTLKALPLKLQAPRPLVEAISSAGGVRFEALDENLMLKIIPGVFCAGEMLDWEAPTGGYLLTACFASGRKAAEGVLAALKT